MSGGQFVVVSFVYKKKENILLSNQAETEFYKRNHRISASEYNTEYVEDNNTKTFDIDRCNKMSDLKCLGQLKTYINVLYQGLCQPELLDPVCLLRPDARGDDPDDVCQVSQDVSFELKVFKMFYLVLTQEISHQLYPSWRLHSG